MYSPFERALSMKRALYKFGIIIIIIINKVSPFVCILLHIQRYSRSILII